MNRIQASILSLMLLPGLAGCNGSDSAPPQDTTQNGGGTFAQKGEPGKDGAPGTNGAAGINGNDGAAGEPGINGNDGANGEPGKNGTDGEAGKNGNDGQPGKDGEAGKKGTDGQAGPAGPKGEDGKIIPVALPAHGTITERPDGFDVQVQRDVLEIRAATANAFRVHYIPEGVVPEPTRVIDPNFKFDATFEVRGTTDANGKVLTKDLVKGQHTARWIPASSTVEIYNGNVRIMWISTDDIRNGSVFVNYNAGATFYGIGGSAEYETTTDLFREGEQALNTGDQGHGGAPFIWSTAGYGVLADTMGNRDRRVYVRSNRIVFAGTSKRDADAYLLVGTPAQMFETMSKISGPTPLFPKWFMGFINSQWGANNAWDDIGVDNGLTEAKLRTTIARYRAENVPLDAFTFDLDWMYWGGTNGTGTAQPDGQFRWNIEKFPGMADNATENNRLRPWLDQRGVRLTTILKPRIPVDSVEGEEATDRGFWMPTTKPVKDYFTETQMQHLNFGSQAVRNWYFNKLTGVFDSGVLGWWNDEFGSSNATDDGGETEGFDMQRGVYDWQRGLATQRNLAAQALTPPGPAVPNLRVWSINRNFYLGAQRYAYGLWSGDIENGFASMASQRLKMLSAINAGAQQWTMDAGGFQRGEGGAAEHQSYARWLQFAAFTPIFRVHGTNGVQRQPWWYAPSGQPTAIAAVGAIRLRYRLIPYIYSYEHQRRKTGVGLVRPLLFDWPEDQNVRNNFDSWMFGDWLLVSPVVEAGQTSKGIYLPQGTWRDWSSGTVRQGGGLINYNTQSWEDNIPLFVRRGAIIPMQPDMQWVGQVPLTQLDVEVYPDTNLTSFEYYDDDGTTYDYENGNYFAQRFSVQQSAIGVTGTPGTVTFTVAAREGTYTPQTTSYLVKIYDSSASAVSLGGQPMTSFGTLAALINGTGEGWAAGLETAPTEQTIPSSPTVRTIRPGQANRLVTYIRLTAGEVKRVVLTTQ